MIYTKIRAARITSVIIVIVLMAESRENGLRYENLIANRAVLTLGKTGFGTSRSFSLVNDLGMAESINGNSFSLKLFAAYGTVNYAIIRTVRYTVGSYVVFFSSFACGMTESGYNGLRYENFTANRAVLTLGDSVFGASRSFRFINNNRMTKSVNNGLRYKNLVTNRAVLTLGKTGFGTSRSFCRVNNLGVSERVDYLLRDEDCVASRAACTFGKTGFGTSGSLCLINNLVVTESSKRFVSV